MERNCPKCGKEQQFKSKIGFISSIKNNRLCRSCSKTGNKNPSFGIYPSYEIRKKISISNSGIPKSEEHKNKLSKSLIGKYVGNKNPFYGKHHSENTKEKLSNLQKGSLSFKYNKSISDETKRKMRIAILNRMEKTGVSPCKDIGSVNFFNKMNKLGFNFKSKKFMEIGYVADGYDENKHIWCEFDTPYHNKKYMKEKDEIRQKHIINYFESINNPLFEFIRVRSDKNGNVLATECVYRGNQ